MCRVHLPFPLVNKLYYTASCLLGQYSDNDDEKVVLMSPEVELEWVKLEHACNCFDTNTQIYFIIIIFWMKTTSSKSMQRGLAHNKIIFLLFYFILKKFIILLFCEQQKKIH